MILKVVLEPTSAASSGNLIANANSPAPQEHTALNIKIQAAQSHAKPTDIQKLATGHFIELQREEIQLHPPEYRRKLP